MKNHYNPKESLQPFFENGDITDVLFPVKSGKEATVFCVRTSDRHGGVLAAAKVYRPREQRNFKNDSAYRQGRAIRDSRSARAVKNKSSAGQGYLFGTWIGHEASTLRALYENGLPVPRVLTSIGDALLMGFVGDEDGAAPQLLNVDPTCAQAVPLFYNLMRDIETMLRCGHIHGDLSEYNLLFWQNRIVIIDVPQTADPWANPDALDLLVRDVTNVCDYFADCGVRTGDAERIARGMWHRLRYGTQS